MDNISWPVVVAYLASYLMSTLGQYLLTDAIMRKQRKFPLRIVCACYFAVYVARSLHCLLLPASVTRNVITTIASFLVVTFLYRASMLKRVMAAIVGVVLAVFGESLIAVGFSALMNVSLPGLLGETQSLVIGIVCSGILTLLLDTMVCLIFRMSDVKIEPPKLYTVAIIAIPTISILVFLSTVGGILDGQEVSLSRLAAAFLVSIGVNIVVFLIYRLLVKESNTRYEKILLQHQSRAYAQELSLKQQSEQSIRALRHDLKNHIAAAKELIHQERFDELNDYLGRLTDAVELPDQYVRTGFSDLDSVLNYKLGVAVKAGAELDVDVVVPERFGVEPFDLVAILGNLLDNAIEGIAPCEEKRLTVRIRLDKGVLFIIIQNTFDGIVRKNTSGKLLTRKGSEPGHGIGLSNVERALEQYNGNLKVEHEDNVFTVTAILYPKEELTIEDQGEIMNV